MHHTLNPNPYRPRAAAAVIALISIAAALASLSVHAGTAGLTPFQLKNDNSGLCVERGTELPKPNTLQPCNDTVRQKFYVLGPNTPNGIIPQMLAQTPGPFRIVAANAYDWEGDVRPLMSAGLEAQTYNVHAGGLPDPGPLGTWTFERGQPATTYTKFQFVIKNAADSYCLSTRMGATAPGTAVIVGGCNGPWMYWTLQPTTYSPPN